MRALLLYFCMIATATAQTAVPPSPTAEWLLTQASVSGTTVADASGNGNPGTVVNGPLTFGATGANFSGQQYIDSPLTITTPALTVSVWFNVAKFAGGDPRLVANSHTDGDNKGFQLMLGGGGTSGFFDVGNGNAEGRAAWSKQIVPGTLYHYVGVYDGATVKAYIDGAQVASVAFAGGAIAAGTGPHINVARSPTYGGDLFTGAIYDVRLYKAALTAAQVTALYQARQTCPAGEYMVSSAPFTCVPVQGMCDPMPVPGSTCKVGDSCFHVDRPPGLAIVSWAVCDGTWAVGNPQIGQTK